MQLPQIGATASLDQLEQQEMEGNLSPEGYCLLMAKYLEEPTALRDARFLWKRLPDAVKVSSPEILALWGIGQCLWRKNFVAFYGACEAHAWSAQIQPIVQSIVEKTRLRLFNLVAKAYSCIREDKLAEFLHVPAAQAVQEAITQGWQYDEANRMLKPKRPDPSPPKNNDAGGQIEPLVKFISFLEK